MMCSAVQRRGGWLVVSAAVSALAACLPPLSADDVRSDARGTLILLDGGSRSFESLEIQDGRLQGSGLSEAVTLDDLQRIELSPKRQPQDPSPFVVEIRGGGRLLAREVTIAKEQCRVRWLGEPLDLPLDVVRSIRFDAGPPSDDFQRVRAAPAAELDRLFLQDDAGKLTSLAVTVEGLDSERLTFTASGQEQQVLRSKVFGVVIAQPAAADPSPYCLVTFRDASQLGGTSLSLAGGQAALALAGGVPARFTWSEVRRVTIRSPRMAFLSDLKPLAEEQQPIVTLPFPARRDRGVTGQPLQIGTVTFDKGLGVHARSSLTFSADKKWDLLIATIGLDAATGGKGDCVFVVEADGEQLLERRMQGAAAAEPIQVPIAGRSQVTLRVEPGAGLDLADHANWAEARFVKGR